MTGKATSLAANKNAHHKARREHSRNRRFPRGRKAWWRELMEKNTQRGQREAEQMQVLTCCSHLSSLPCRGRAHAASHRAASFISNPLKQPIYKVIVSCDERFCLRDPDWSKRTDLHTEGKQSRLSLPLIRAQAAAEIPAPESTGFTSSPNSVLMTSRNLSIPARFWSCCPYCAPNCKLSCLASSQRQDSAPKPAVFQFSLSLGSFKKQLSTSDHLSVTIWCLRKGSKQGKHVSKARNIMSIPPRRWVGGIHLGISP